MVNPRRNQSPQRWGVQRSDSANEGSVSKIDEISIRENEEMVEKLRKEIAKLDKAIKKYDGCFDISSVVVKREKKQKQLNALIMLEIPKIGW